MASIAFHGAARTVTGSKHLLNLSGKQILVDCGIFQGSRELRDRNYHPFPFDPAELDLVILTHAHMDHIGMIPKLVKEGYRGKIYCTKATKGLAAISLPDSGRIQEEDAYHARKHGSRHPNPIPLYTEADAYACLKQFEALSYLDMHALPGGAQFCYRPAGHILGSAYAEIYFENGERILMSGDLGRYDTPIIKDPTSVDFAEYIVIESTYGDRLHSDEDPMVKLETVINYAVESSSAVLVPSFAIGRTQEMLYYISMLETEGRIPSIPVYIDSPMATSTSTLYGESSEEWDEEMQMMVKARQSPLEPRNLTYTRDRNQSKALNAQRGPMIIIAGSGMANAGRIVHHLIHRLSDPTTTVLFTGFQAEGTLGRQLLEHAPEVQIHRQQIAVRAKIDKMNALSAHADQGEMLRWLSGFSKEPKKTFIVHGEPHAQEALATKIRTELGWTNLNIPSQGEEFELA